MQIPDYYEFLNYPKIVSGKCALENIPSELDGYDAQKPLVIAGKNMVQRGLAKKFSRAFCDSTMVLGAIYDEVRDYAGISLARDAASLFKARGCDAIIALGNGPVVDLAKAVNVLVSEKIDTLQPYNEGAVIRCTLKPLIVVPGCSFDGWEATSTMTVDNRRVTSDHLYPRAIVIDSRITTGCCPECVAESGMIALTQAFTALMDEAHNPMIDAVAHPALSLISEHLAKGIRKPKNSAACLALANAAVMATVAYSNTRPGMAVLLAEALSSASGISVGKLTGILLPSIIATIREKENSIREELCLALAGLEAYAAMPEGERPKKGLEMALNLIDGLRGILPRSLQELRIQKHILDKVVATVATKSAQRFTEAECRSVLAHAWQVTAG